MSAIHSRRLEKELIDRKLVPDGCRFLSLVIEVGRPITMHLEKFPDVIELVQLGDALKAAADIPERSDDVTP